MFGQNSETGRGGGTKFGGVGDVLIELAGLLNEKGAKL